MKHLLPLIALILLTACQKDTEPPERCVMEQVGEELYCGNILPSEEEMKRLDEIAKNAAKATMTYYIPVYVHVLYDGNSEVDKLTRPEAVRGLKRLRDVMRNEGGQFHPLGVDMQIEIVPQNIIYHDGTELWGEQFATYGIRFSGTQGIPSSSLEPLRAIDPDALHIFVPFRISPGNIGGFASFATNNSITHVTRRLYFDHGILSHEFGHNMFLYHTFHLTSSCDIGDVDCTIQGDRVCDTPVQVQSWSCGDICGEQIENIMGYSIPCLNRFTEGQRDRSHDLLDFYKPNWQTPLTPFNFDDIPALIEPMRRNSSMGYLQWHQWGCDSVKTYVSPTSNGQDVTVLDWEFVDFFNENNPNHSANFEGTRYYGFRILRNGQWSWYRDAYKVQQNGPIQRIQNFNFETQP